MSIDKRLAVAFTGHRPQSLPWRANEMAPSCEAFKALLYESVVEAYDRGYRQFLVGMALGADLICAELLCAMRADTRYAALRVIAVLPCAGQDARWGERDRARYRRLLSACDEVITLQAVYTPECILARNDYMVDQASHLIAAWGGRARGETYHAIARARRHGLTVDVLRMDMLSDDALVYDTRAAGGYVPKPRRCGGASEDVLITGCQW